jgi:hypothetical protein
MPLPHHLDDAVSVIMEFGRRLLKFLQLFELGRALRFRILEILDLPLF